MNRVVETSKAPEKRSCPHCREIVLVTRTLGNIYCTQCHRWLAAQGDEIQPHF